MKDYGWQILPSHFRGFLGLKMSVVEDSEGERINRSQVHLATATTSSEQRRSADETQAQWRSTAKGQDQWQAPVKRQEQLRRPVRIKDLLEVPIRSQEQLGRPIKIQDLLEVPISSQVQLRRPKKKYEEERERPPETQEENLAPAESQEHQELLGKCDTCPWRSADHQEPQQRPTSLQEGTLKLTESQTQASGAPHEPYICRGRGERTSAKEITMNPLQEWGEEVEDGVIYSVTLRRVKMEPDGSDSGGLMVDPDSSPMPCCGYVQYKTCKLRTLKAGSLEKLVENLITTDGSSDQAYVSCFLATYRAFTSTETVLKVLLDRKLGCDEEDRSKWPRSPAPDTAGIRRAVRRVLSMWLEEYPDDFRQKPHYPCLKMIQEYLRKGSLGAEEEKENQQVSSLLQQFKEEDTDEDSEKSASSPHPFSFVASENGEESDVPEEKVDLLSFPADEVAEQLTLMDAMPSIQILNYLWYLSVKQELFQRVVPFHCLGCIWSQRDKKEKKHVAPTVRATVAQFNAVTSSVMASVLADVQLRAQQRAKVLEKWISIAQKCRVLRNFSSLRAILSALQSNPIYRLKRAWAAVNRDSVTTFHKLSDIFSDENNHLTSREILMQEELPAGAPCENSCRDDSKLAQKSSTQDRNMRPPQGTVPYLGTFLTDLIMLDTALPDFLENGMINFEKRRKEFEVLSTILKLQQTCQHYCLLPRPQIVSVFVRHRQLTDDQSYRVSRTIEPPADSCPNSPRIRRRLTKRFSSLLLGSEVFGPKQNGDRGGISPSGSSSSCDMDDGLLSPTLCVPDAAAAFPKSLLELPLNSPTSVCFQEDSLSPTASPTLAKQPLARVSSLPVYNQQIADLCIIRVSMENNHGNLYKSILLTSQDKTLTVILRALQKHNLDSSAPEDFQLIQLLDGNREFIIPDKANVYYAMSTSVNFDFILRRKSSSGPIPQPRSTPSSPSSPLPRARTANIPATVNLLGGHSLPRLL